MRKRNKRKDNGRPRIPIDWAWVDQQLMAGCIGTEIAAGLGIHPETFYARVEQEKQTGFSEYAAAKRADGDRLLRGVQYKNALKGNTTMQIWLGKQRLNQRELMESAIAPETMKEFKSIMNQLTDYQEALKIADINNNDE